MAGGYIYQKPSLFPYAAKPISRKTTSRKPCFAVSGHLYDVMGWNAMPEFVALKRRHRQYMMSERDQLLDMACGPDGFDTWQPSDSECGRNAAPTFPN